jgi:hypothetical protein
MDRCKGRLMKSIFAIFCLLAALGAQAQTTVSAPFQPYGNTITFTANISGSIPTPVQTTGGTFSTSQYLVSNVGANDVFVSYSTVSATATANCVVPTGTATAVVPVFARTQVIFTTATGSYFCGITSAGTSAVYVTPGVGQ